MKQFDFSYFLNVKRTNGAEIQAFCPFHSDRSPSFSANVEKGVWTCHAGCGSGTFSTFLQLIKEGRSGDPVKKQSSQSTSGQDLSGFRKVAEYVYLGFGGRECLKVVRFEDSEGNKRIFQKCRNDQGCWIPGGTKDLVLPYRYQDWRHLDPSETILIVEGEKCVDFLIAHRFAATTFVRGAGGWREGYKGLFKGRKIGILPDHDLPGKEFGEAVFAGLMGVCQVSLIELPGLREADDVVDWFKSGGTASKLKELIA